MVYAQYLCKGASIAVECKEGNSKLKFKKEVKTDKHGDFKVHLVFQVSKHVRRIKGCTLKFLSSNEAHCVVSSTATSFSLSLKSRRQR